MEQNFTNENSISLIESVTSKKMPGKPRNRWARAIPWYSDAFNPVFGESSLWLAVITQAMMDALNRSPDPLQRMYKRDAIDWLTSNGKDFHYVCLLAGVDAATIRRAAKKAILNNTRWRAEPGKGKRYQEKKRYRTRSQKRPSLPSHCVDAILQCTLIHIS